MRVMKYFILFIREQKLRLIPSTVNLWRRQGFLVAGTWRPRKVAPTCQNSDPRSRPARGEAGIY